MFKKVIFSAISLFLAFRSYELLAVLIARVPDELGTKGEVLMAVLLNVFITGMVAIPGFAFPSHKLFGTGYYVVKNPSLIQKLYKVLHVELFRKGLMLAFWGRKNNRRKFFDGRASGIENFTYQSKQSEFGHMLSFLLLSLACVALLFKGYCVLVLVASIINVVGNLYPSILQRMHRIRIERVVQLKQISKATKNGN